MKRLVAIVDVRSSHSSVLVLLIPRIAINKSVTELLTASKVTPVTDSLILKSLANAFRTGQKLEDFNNEGNQI